MSVVEVSSGSILWLDVERADGAYVITAAGEVDLSSVGELAEELARAESSDAHRIIVDLSGVSFIDSTGLRVLLQAELASRANGGRLHFLRGQRAVERLMELTGIGRELRFLD